MATKFEGYYDKRRFFFSIKGKKLQIFKNKVNIASRELKLCLSIT